MCLRYSIITIYIKYKFLIIDLCGCSTIYNLIDDKHKIVLNKNFARAIIVLLRIYTYIVFYITIKSYIS